MGILAEVERAQEQERKRRERIAQMAVIATDVLRASVSAQFTREERVLLVGLIANALDGTDAETAIMETAKVPATDKPEIGTVIKMTARAPTLKGTAVSLLRQAPGGLSIHDLAEGVYGDRFRKSCHKARSLIDYLVRRHEAHERGGRWYYGTKNGDPISERVENDDASATPLARRVLVEATRPLNVQEIVAAVVALNTDTPKPHIYSAVYKMQKRGEITKTDDGRYTLSRQRVRSGAAAE